MIEVVLGLQLDRTNFLTRTVVAGPASDILELMGLVGRSAAATFLAVFLCLVCVGAGFTDLPVEDADVAVAAECSLAVVANIAGDQLAAPLPRLRASYVTYDARLYRADLARAKRWGS